MKKIAEQIGRELKWEQPSALKQEFELRAREELVATLRFKSSFGSFATGESADGCWTFKRFGFLHTGATIRVCGSDADVATFRNKTWSGGGSLTLGDGREYLANTNVWQTKFEFQDKSGDVLVRFKSGGLVHLSAVLEVQPKAAEIPELPWFVMLGWYLTVMMHRDSAAAGAAAAG